MILSINLYKLCVFNFPTTQILAVCHMCLRVTSVMMENQGPFGPFSTPKALRLLHSLAKSSLRELILSQNSWPRVTSQRKHHALLSSCGTKASRDPRSFWKLCSLRLVAGLGLMTSLFRFQFFLELFLHTDPLTSKDGRHKLEDSQFHGCLPQ